MMKINPVEIIKAINTSRKSREDSVAAYVRKVATEANELANIWEEVANSIILGNEINREKLIEMGAHKWLAINNRPYSLINEFYMDVSTALGTNGGSKWVDKITFGLGTIINNRENANETLLKILENRGNHFFFNDRNQQEVLNDLASSVIAIRKEASTLQILSNNIDANNY